MSCTGLPHFARGKVTKGFGRGSKELGIPTGIISMKGNTKSESFTKPNLPVETVNKLPEDLQPGVYFGWAKIDNGCIYKMVMSIGWNPFYKNIQKSMEVHIIHKFDNDFYDCILSIIITGYIRPEKDFSNVDDLIKTIENDIDIAVKELDKPEYSIFKVNAFFKELVDPQSCCHKAETS